MTLPPHRLPKGYTLIEMLIVVAIIGILAAIAFPGYQSYVQKTNRTVAKAALSAITSRQESYATDHKAYAQNFKRLGFTGSGDGSSAYVNSQGEISLNDRSALYELKLHSQPASGLSSCGGLSGSPSAFAYAVSAVPKLARTDPKCGTVCLASTGDRGATGGAESCWKS